MTIPTGSYRLSDEMNSRKQNETRRVYGNVAGGSTPGTKFNRHARRRCAVGFLSTTCRPCRGEMLSLSPTPGATRGYGPSIPPGFLLHSKVQPLT